MDPILWTYNRLYRWFKQPAVKKVLQRLLPFRMAFILPFHIGLFACSFYGAFLLTSGWNELIDLVAVLSVPLAALIVIRLRCLPLLRSVPRAIGGYVSFEDLINIVRANGDQLAYFLWRRHGLGTGLHQ